MAEYRPQCAQCHIYPVRAAGAETCARCEREAREQQQLREREKQWRTPKQAQAEHQTREHVPYCGACLTTLHVRDVRDGVGLCIGCKLKQRAARAHTLAISYGQHTPKAQDPNNIY